MLAKRQQSGFALLIFLIILIGMGAFVVEGYIQNIAKEVSVKKIKKNQEVLNEAKQALLMYVYNYPMISLANSGTARGPGRLPCPDMDGDGDADPSFFCISSSIPMIGRFPYKTPGLDFYDVKDADDEQLWYAVSRNFAYTGPATINSGTKGTITLVDQSGSIIYDGFVAGIAAVIIAPGRAINRDENNDGVYEYAQLRNTAAQRTSPRNYLDTFNGFDNSVFVNSSAATADGFILGPVKDPVQNSIVINDQMVIITAEEVAAMSEKPVLDEYRKAIADYRSIVPGGGYPWLFDYATTNLDTFNSGLTNIGRIPSIYANYFSDNDSVPIHSEIRLSFSKSYRVNGDVSGNTYTFISDPNPSGVIAGVKFEDIGDGLLTGNALAYSYERIKYFYDDLTASPAVWKACGDDGNGIAELTDCNRDGAGFSTPGVGSNGTSSKILKVGMRVDYSSGVLFDLNYSPPVNVLHIDAGALTHAEIRQTFTADKVTTLPAVLYYDQFDYAVGGTVTNTVAEVSQVVSDNTAFGDLINQSISDIEIGLRYYPVLPAWVGENEWHKQIMMAIASTHQPQAPAALPVPCTAASTCLIVADIGAGQTTDNKISLLLSPGSGNLIDEGANGFSDDLDDIFDPGNFDLDRNFFKHTGNDAILILQEQ